MRPTILVACLVSLCIVASAQTAPAVRLWEENVVIPTYVAGPPDNNPFFYTGRTYQGAKGFIYPYAMIDTLSDKKEDKTYKQICLENEYVKICVLPELGGRIFEALDKTNGYHFFYKQSVIKPALIGMLGAWISGGVEWDLPHHHRATSFMTVESKTQENADGSKTVWIGEMELRDRMRWVVGLTLRPGTSLLEAKVTALNTTPFANSLLYFANVAVHTNENYQVIFPPRTQFVTQHAKREFARWPIADSVYGGVNFKGVDVSWWKNHPSSISMFAWNEDDDFLAGYDHGRQAGTIHVADHHQAPGKKFFTWGNGAVGHLWDNILSDTDGPYLELMVGAWSDNQPDYSWMQPYEAKTVTQYWYPFRAIGGVKEANTSAAVNLDVKDGQAHVGFFVTRVRKQVRAVLTAAGKEIWSATADLDPGHALVHDVPLPAGTEPTALRAALLAPSGEELVAYQPVRLDKLPMPKPVVPPTTPERMKTAEELYLAGLRLEQFHSPALEPDPYYEEALKRDPGDVRAHTALGILDLKRARYADAERHLRAAVDRLTYNYTRPRDGEALYYLGVALKFEEKYKEAEDALQRAAWTYAWQSPAYFQLAELASLRGNLEQALALADRALVTNAWNTRALSLKSTLLGRLGRGGEAREARQQLARIDPLDPRGYRDPLELVGIFQQFPDEGLELVVSCLNAGLWREAEILLDRMPVQSPMVAYYRGWLAMKNGQSDTARAHFARGSAMSFERVFPFQLEVIPALRAAMEANPNDARPAYYLGTFLYDRQPEEAVKLWQIALNRAPHLAIAWRNLAVAWARSEQTVPKAIDALEKAIALSPDDALWFYDLDRLYEGAQVPVEKRFALIDQHADVVQKRDDAMAREVTLLNLTGRYDRAIDIMATRHFHIWEGGARFSVQDAWTDAHLLRGHRSMAAKDYQAALKDYLGAIEYPSNIEATRGYRGSRAPEVYYWAGKAYAALGKTAEAQKAWKESAAALTGSDENPRATAGSGAALLFYQALSLDALGQKERARAVFASLKRAGEEALARPASADFFAKFGERGSAGSREAMAHYVIGLGSLGLGEAAAAKASFQKALDLNHYLLDAKARLEALNAQPTNPAR